MRTDIESFQVDDDGLIGHTFGCGCCSGPVSFRDADHAVSHIQARIEMVRKELSDLEELKRHVESGNCSFDSGWDLARDPY